MASSSSGGYVSRYDVFLSFRGEDTRNSFTDHLYQALRRAGIYTFRDDDAIPRGEDLKPEIKRGIRESRASIIVLSELYATSGWCLDELYLILKQRKTCNHFVLPIFYHVDPSHVRKREGTFKIEAKAGTKWTEDKVKQWNKALKKVGTISGKVVSGSETDFIIAIVDSIKEKLDLKHVYRQGNLVGMETGDKEINSWLEQPDCEIIAISGIGGCGKTTLARHIAYSNWCKFEGVSILEDIGSRSTEPLRQLQERLIRDIIQGKEKTIPSVWEGTYTIENALQRKKVLIVLDNIVTKKQVVDLLGTGTKTHSKIIITTREKDPSTWFESHPWRCRVHTMKLLDDDDSLKLLNLHAFKSNALKEVYHEELAQAVLQYCQGNPLALEVLGSSLNRDSRKEFWKSILDSLEREVPGEIQRVLLTSYNSLHLSEKELFLHIACFFIGRNRGDIEKILEPNYFAISGIVTLINSSLLSVSPDNKLMMHRLLQEMAKTIVLEESPRRPGHRSRVCRDAESYDVLVNKKGSKMVEGLALNMELLNHLHVSRQLHGIQELSSLVDTNSFEKMNNLKLLLLSQLELTGSYSYFSKDLRFLCLRGFHLEAIPSELYMGKLVAIDMSYGKLKLFQPPYVLPSLKILDLSDSYDLIEICNVSLLPNLETLVLWNCRKLVRVCDTLGDHECLILLNITGCENLFKRKQRITFERIQFSLLGGQNTNRTSFRLPRKLEQLSLKDTNLEDTDYFPLSFKAQPNLKYLNLVNGPFENLPDYPHLENLLVLDLSFCKKLKSLLNLPHRLAELYIFYCISLERVTFESHKYTLKEFKYEGCVSLSEVENLFKLMPVAKLKETELGHMKWLREYQDLEVHLVGDDDLTKGRSLRLQMLYEFNIMSISLPDIERPNMIPEYEYTAEHEVLSFEVPECQKNMRFKGLNIGFKYTVQGDNWVWFAKISSTGGFDLTYDAKVFGKPASDEAGIWLSYWPIGGSLHVGDEVNVSIVVTKGLEIHGCGASLVYTVEEEGSKSFEDADESYEEANDYFEDNDESFEDNNEHEDIVGGDISGFKLGTGTYYLCRRDYNHLMEVGRLTPNWFRNIVGDKIDYTEIGGWRKTGRPDQVYQSYTELKRTGCLYGPQLDEYYTTEELSKASLKTVDLASKFGKEATKSAYLKTDMNEKTDYIESLEQMFVLLLKSKFNMTRLVILNMSNTWLEAFEIPWVLPSLRVLNLTDSHNLFEIRNISQLPNLETLILCYCRRLVCVRDSLGDLKRLTKLDMTGCKNLCKEQPESYDKTKVSLFGGQNTKQPHFLLPNSSKQLLLKDCNLKDTDYFPLSFKNQSQLEYLNLAGNVFELLPSYTHLNNLRVLDLSGCRALKRLWCLPSKLAELYIFYCDSLESVTFESHKYTLQEFRYEGCINLSEVEDFFKFMPVAMLTEADLGHMNWLRAYQDLEVCMVGDDDLTKGRSLCLQMLYEFNIMSISLPDIEKPNIIPEYEYTSDNPLLSFEVPERSSNRTLKGLNITFKYTIQGDEWVWFAKIRTNKGVELIYNPKVFGKPAADKVGIWLSYWPIGESLQDGDEVDVAIVVMKGNLVIQGCGASLVYTDEIESFQDSNESMVDANESYEDNDESFEEKNSHADTLGADILGADISGFKLSNGTYYLCRRDYSQLMEVDRLNPNWFRNLVGDTIDYTEIGGWRKTGRPNKPYQSFTELKNIRCTIYGPQSNEFYTIEELTKSSLVDEDVEFTSEFSDKTTKSVDIRERMESTSSSLTELTKYSGPLFRNSAGKEGVKEMTSRRPSILNRSSTQTQTELPTQEDQIRGYRQMARSRYQAARTTRRVFGRNNYSKTLDSIVYPERQLKKLRERRASLVPAEVLYSNNRGTTRNRVYEHYSEQRILCVSENQVNLRLCNQESYQSLRSSGLQHIHLGIFMIRLHALHLTSAGTKALIVLRDTRWEDSRQIIGTKEVDLSQGTRLVYMFPDMLLSIDHFHNHVEVVIQTHGYETWQGGESNLLITMAMTGRLSNISYMGFQYSVENVVDHLTTNGITAIPGESRSVEELEEMSWNLKPSEQTSEQISSVVRVRSSVALDERFERYRHAPQPARYSVDQHDREVLGKRSS